MSEQEPADVSGDEQKPSISDEVDLFTNHLEGLNEALPLMMFMMQELEKTNRTELEKFEKQNCAIIETELDRTVTIPPEHYKQWKSKKSPVDKLKTARILVPRSLVVTMVSQYDAFLGRLLKTIFLLKPEILQASERVFTFPEVSSFGSIEEFKSHVVEKEVESVLRKSHHEQFQYMENKFSLILTRGLNKWPTFIELTERRNLFVHTDGVVSNQYIKVCKEHNCPLDSLIAEGKKLGVTHQYARDSYNCLYEIGVKLAHVLWRKILPEQRELADTSFNSTAYDLLDRGEYDLACALMDFALAEFVRHSSTYNKSIVTVNCAQAHKWAGRNEQAKKIMDGHDWSASGEEFKLANAVLNENWVEAGNIVRRIGATGVIDAIQYRDWPLFKEFRKRQEFLDSYKDVFGKNFELKISASNQKIEPTGITVSNDDEDKAIDNLKKDMLN